MRNDDRLLPRGRDLRAAILATCLLVGGGWLLAAAASTLAQL